MSIENKNDRICEIVVIYKKGCRFIWHLNLRQFDYKVDRIVSGHDMDETWVANGGTVDTTESWDDCAQKCLEYQPKCKGFSWVMPGRHDVVLDDMM